MSYILPLYLSSLFKYILIKLVISFISISLGVGVYTYIGTAG
jgi:hypothetical protein